MGNFHKEKGNYRDKTYSKGYKSYPKKPKKPKKPFFKFKKIQYATIPETFEQRRENKEYRRKMYYYALADYNESEKTFEDKKVLRNKINYLVRYLFKNHDLFHYSEYAEKGGWVYEAMQIRKDINEDIEIYLQDKEQAEHLEKLKQGLKDKPKIKLKKKFS